LRFLYAIGALGILIAVHELGHLIAARSFGIKVLQYTFGFGPPLWTFKRRHTEYRLAAIPFGGSVRIHGLNPHQEGLIASDPTSFGAKRLWQRVLVLASGSIMNLLFAFAALTVLHLVGTHVQVPMTIGKVEPGSPAARAQLRPGDVVAAVDNQPVQKWSVLVDLINERPDQRILLTVLRGGEPFAIEVRSVTDSHGFGQIGIREQYVFRQHTFGESLIQAGRYIGRLVGEGAQAAFRIALRKRPVDSTMPAAMATQTADSAKSGFNSFLRVLINFSIALSVFYLLPLPAVDGGRIGFALYEWVTGRRMNSKLETLLHTLGFLVLVAAILAVAGNELWFALR
jgi:regulator of sigma E protease